MLLRARAIRNPTWAKGVEPLVFRAGIFQNESDLISRFNTTLQSFGSVTVDFKSSPE
jgi:hypothetical protein